MTSSDGTNQPTVVFDVMGTLFDLERVRSSFVGLGAPPAALEAWFQRILHEAACVTILEAYRPFKDLATAALRTTLAQLDLDPGRTEPLDALAELDPYPDAADALRQLAASGVRVLALTNGSVESTTKLLERAAIRERFQEIWSCDQVERFKPHPAPYALALDTTGGSAIMVAAHGWDVLGARAAGMDAIWIDREEKQWPFPGEQPERVPTLAAAADAILARR